MAQVFIFILSDVVFGPSGDGTVRDPITFLTVQYCVWLMFWHPANKFICNQENTINVILDFGNFTTDKYKIPFQWQLLNELN